MAGIDVPDGQYTAVVDSIEDGLATVFFEQDGDNVGDALLDASVLPAEACHADAVITVTIADRELITSKYEPERTEDRAEKAQSRFNRLSKRPPSDDDT